MSTDGMCPVCMQRARIDNSTQRLVKHKAADGARCAGTDQMPIGRGGVAQATSGRDGDRPVRPRGRRPS